MSSPVAAAVPLCASLAAACARWPQRPAVTFGNDTLTYAQLWEQISALADAYAQLGIGPGDRVLCQLRNCPEQIVAVGAAWARGAIHIGADNDLTGHELIRLIQRLDAVALVYQPPLRSATASESAPMAGLTQVAQTTPHTIRIVHGTANDVPTGLAHSFAELANSQSGAATPPHQPGPLDPAVIFLTSGTTGEAKAVVEPFAAHWAKMQFFTDGFRPGSDDVHLLCLPVAHVFGFRLALLALLRGGHLILAERFSAQAILATVTQQQVTVLPAVPTHLRLLREQFDPARHDVASLRWVLSAAAGLPGPLAEWVYTDLDAQIMFVFGCSEGFTTATTARQDILDSSVGSRVFRGPAGTPADGTVAIVDPDSRQPVPIGDTGEIVFGAAVPVKYWDHPDAATDGWYRTGDLGRMDDHRRLFVVGRLKELVNRAGLHVSAAEVELALVRHEQVSDAAVVATPDEVLGEAVCACIVTAGNVAPDLAAVRAFLGTTLARHKLPDELCVVAAIPRTVIGKVDRAALLRQVLADGIPRQRSRK